MLNVLFSNSAEPCNLVSWQTSTSQTNMEATRWRKSGDFPVRKRCFSHPFSSLKLQCGSYHNSLTWCQAAQHANPWKHMSEKVWRGFSGDVWNRDIQLCSVTGDRGWSQERHFCLCYMFIWQLFRSFSGFEEADMSYLLILGLTVLWIIQIQVSCMKTCLSLSNYLNDLLNCWDMYHGNTIVLTEGKFTLVLLMVLIEGICT